MTNQVNYNKQDNNAKIIETAMSFPLDDLLSKYCMEHSLPMETAREHEREIKRFLVLSVINSSTKYVMSGPMDELWHSFILFTKKYHDFCYLVAGGYMQLLQDYKVLFGEEPPSQYWPRLEKKSSNSASNACAPHCVGSVTCAT